MSWFNFIFSSDNTPTNFMFFQKNNTLRHILTINAEFVNTPQPGKCSGWWSVVDAAEPHSMEDDTPEQRESPLAEITPEPPMVAMPPALPLVWHLRLPVPIRQSLFDSKGKPTIVWDPPPSFSAFPPPVESPIMRGRLDPLPSQELQQLNAPFPGSALNVSANTHRTDEHLQVSARDEGKGKAREISKNEYDSSHKHWREN